MDSDGFGVDVVDMESELTWELMWTREQMEMHLAVQNFWKKRWRR